MTTEYILALNKRTTVAEYTKELDQLGIQYDRMPRFKRIMKVWIDSPDDLPSRDRIAVISRAEDEVEGEKFPTPNPADIDAYEANTPPIEYTPRTVSEDDSFIASFIKNLIDKFFALFDGGVDDTPKRKYIQAQATTTPIKNQSIRFDNRKAKHSDNWGLGRIGKQNNDFNGKFPYVSSFKYSKTGEGVDVYVVDSGVDNHPELEGRLNYLYGSRSDENGHGTHVATTIAGRRFGVAKQATVHAVRVLGNNGSGSFRTIIDGLEAVLTHHQDKDFERPSVVNMSLGGVASKNGPLAAAVDELIENGIIVVVAAGNDNFDLGRPTDYIPAEVEAAITVGATTINDARAGFSNYGEIIDIWAPGHNITAGYPGNRIAALSGTSMASPHVAGVVALMVQGTKKIVTARAARRVRDTLIEQSTDGKVKWDHVKQSKSPNHLLYMGHTL